MSLSTVSEGGSSPLTRGAPGLITGDLDYTRIIPAHAGSTAFLKGLIFSVADHPRSRGEHTGFEVSRSFMVGSSPLTRGAQI